MHIVPAEDIDARLVSEILSGPDYFTCERTHTRMKKEICIKRQTSGLRNFGGSWKYAREIPSECVNCPQGLDIRKELEEMDREKNTCTMPGCDEPVKAKGLCSWHYNKEYNRQLREKKKSLRGKINIDPAFAKASTGRPAVKEFPITNPDDCIIMVDFGDFPKLLDQLTEQARMDIRSIEHEVLYLVKCGLEEST